MKLEVKFREIMCRMQSSGWTIRFWFTRVNGLTQAAADGKVLEFAESNKLILGSPIANLESIEAMILAEFENTPLAAFEVLDKNGNGMVTYTDW